MSKRPSEVVQSLEEAKRGIENKVLDDQKKLQKTPGVYGTLVKHLDVILKKWSVKAKTPNLEVGISDIGTVLGGGYVLIRRYDRDFFLYKSISPHMPSPYDSDRFEILDITRVVNPGLLINPELLADGYETLGIRKDKKIRILTKKESDSLLNRASSVLKSLLREDGLINSIEKNISEANSLKDRIAKLNRISQLESESPIVGKIWFKLGFADRDFYTLHLANNIVCLYLGDQVEFIATTRRDSPLRLERRVTAAVFSDSALSLIDLLKVENGDFTTNKGYVLNAQQEEIAARVFDHVRTGKEILPAPEVPGGYRIKRQVKDGGVVHNIQYRHWGQQHLAQLNPNGVLEGQLLGGGGSYKAFRFGNKTVVEFDQDERATYLFDTEYFDGLRLWERSRVLTEQPEGFNGRVIHRGDRDNWKKQINDFIIGG